MPLQSFFLSFNSYCNVYLKLFVFCLRSKILVWGQRFLIRHTKIFEKVEEVCMKLSCLCGTSRCTPIFLIFLIYLIYTKMQSFHGITNEKSKVYFSLKQFQNCVFFLTLTSLLHLKTCLNILNLSYLDWKANFLCNKKLKIISLFFHSTLRAQKISISEI